MAYGSHSRGGGSNMVEFLLRKGSFVGGINKAQGFFSVPMVLDMDWW